MLILPAAANAFDLVGLPGVANSAAAAAAVVAAAAAAVGGAAHFMVSRRP